MTLTPRSSLQKEINELKEMSSKGRLRKLLESEIYKVAIARCFKQIDEATKTFLVRTYIPIRFQIYSFVVSSLTFPGAQRGRCMR